MKVNLACSTAAGWKFFFWQHFCCTSIHMSVVYDVNFLQAISLLGWLVSLFNKSEIDNLEGTIKSYPWLKTSDSLIGYLPALLVYCTLHTTRTLRSPLSCLCEQSLMIDSQSLNDENFHKFLSIAVARIKDAMSLNIFLPAWQTGQPL